MEFDSSWMAILKVVIAIVLGGLIGLEREWASKPAGLRTHMLVAGASTLFVVLGSFMLQYFSNSALSSEAFRGDPIRIMEAIITGISFLGAGTIIFKDQKENLEGLTTAASILFVAGIGIAVAIDKFMIAGVLTFVTIAILLVVGILEKQINKWRES